MSLSSDDIALRAYELWEQAGRPEGDGREFWFAAETELLREASARQGILKLFDFVTDLTSRLRGAAK